MGTPGVPPRPVYTGPRTFGTLPKDGTTLPVKDLSVEVAALCRGRLLGLFGPKLQTLATTTSTVITVPQLREQHTGSVQAEVQGASKHAVAQAVNGLQALLVQSMGGVLQNLDLTQSVLSSSHDANKVYVYVDNSNVHTFAPVPYSYKKFSQLTRWLVGGRTPVRRFVSGTM